MHQVVEGQARKSPFLKICGRPQTKNKASIFNELVAEAVMNAGTNPRKEGCDVSFISLTTDAISVSSSFL